MRTTLIALTALLAVPASAAAAAETATFKVSAYGVQRYVNAWTENADTSPLPCGDMRGPISEGTTVRFKTSSPTRMRVTRSGRGYQLVHAGRGSRIHDLSGDGTWQHSYSNGASFWDCETKSEVPAPPEPPGDCSETMSVGLSFRALSAGRGGKVELYGSPEVPPVEPFKGCNHGDHSLSIYPAKGRLPSDLFTADKTEVVLRGYEHDEFSSDAPNAGVGGWKKRITLYLVFKRVR